MNKAAHEFDPHAVLREHKKFFEDNKAAFSPPPKRILTPNESDEKNASLRPTDNKDYYSVMPKQNVPPSNERHSYFEESPDGRNKELLIMTVEIGDGNKDTIRVFEQDDPYDLARKFCESHGLNTKIIEPLAHNIYANMEKVLEERAQILDEENNEEVETKRNEEGFKDLGMRTGEFRGFNETNQGQQQHLQQQQRQQQQQYQNQPQRQQQQNQYQQYIQQYYQQQQQQQQSSQSKYQHQHQSLNISQNEGSELNYSRDQNNKEVQKEYDPNKSVNSPERFGETSQAPWEPREKESGQLAFHMRPSFDGKFMKFRSSSQETTNVFDGTTHHEEPSRNQTSKPLDTTNRKSNFDYPSDFRVQNSSYLPEMFQNEEEYLEYLVASQYGGNQKKPDYRNPDCTFKPQINQSSKMMLESKYQNSSMNVYDRLHNYAKTKTQTKKDPPKSQRTPRKSAGAPPKSAGAIPRKSVGNSRNVLEYQRAGGLGVGLYNRGMKRKEEVQQMLSDFKHEKQLEEERGCTFKPRINRISAEIVNSKPKYESTEVSLINYGRAKQEKLERAKSIQKVREVEGCTFQPMINSISAKLVHQKEHMTQDIVKDRFTKLFYDHRVREAQQESRAKALLSQSGCTFTPMINGHSEAILDQTTIEERAMKFAKKVNKMENLRRQREESELFDVETGQPLFRPSIGRSPKKDKRERKQSIGDYLYNQRFEKETLRKNLSEKEKKQRNSQLIRTSEKSKLIMENIQRTKLQEIFNLLDSDEDGYISSSKIDIGSIGTDILEAFAPLLCEMEELNQVLSLSDFIEAAEKLLRTLPVHQRDEIIMADNINRRTSQATEFRFHPEINKKSARIAQGVRPYGNFEALYDRYIDEKKIHEEKIKLEQQKRREEELRECSFKPMRIPDSDLSLVSMNNYNYYYVDHLI